MPPLVEACTAHPPCARGARASQRHLQWHLQPLASPPNMSRRHTCIVRVRVRVSGSTCYKCAQLCPPRAQQGPARLPCRTPHAKRRSGIRRTHVLTSGARLLRRRINHLHWCEEHTHLGRALRVREERPRSWRISGDAGAQQVCARAVLDTPPSNPSTCGVTTPHNTRVHAYTRHARGHATSARGGEWGRATAAACHGRHRALRAPRATQHLPNRSNCGRERYIRAPGMDSRKRPCLRTPHPGRAGTCVCTAALMGGGAASLRKHACSPFPRHAGHQGPRWGDGMYTCTREPDARVVTRALGLARPMHPTQQSRAACTRRHLRSPSAEPPWPL